MISKRIAAIDLGSNSFHMLLAEASAETFTTCHKEKKLVALARGLNDNNQLSDDSIEYALQTLRTFADILLLFKPDIVRIVGTYTFRSATNIVQLTQQAQEFLPYPIEILSGFEEARLIFLGVSHNIQLKSNHLIIDIGGGSTEMIIGKGHTPIQLNSCNVGCVSLSNNYFNEPEISLDKFQQAIDYAKQQFEPIRESYLKTGWTSVIGTSGTVKAIYKFVAQHKIINDTIPSSISYETLQDIKTKLLNAGTVSAIDLNGIKEERYSVICGGLSVLIAIFEAMEIDTMDYCDFALREGLLAEINQDFT